MQNSDWEKFLNENQDIKPLDQDKNFKQRTIKEKVEEVILDNDLAEHCYFSEEYQPIIKNNDTINFVRESKYNYLLTRLKQGNIEPQLQVDLHGLSKRQAVAELNLFLKECEKNNIYCGLVITGIGQGILQTQVPMWLYQYEKIVAMHKAPKSMGSKSAIIFLLQSVEMDLKI